MDDSRLAPRRAAKHIEWADADLESIDAQESHALGLKITDWCILHFIATGSRPNPSQAQREWAEAFSVGDLQLTPWGMIEVAKSDSLHMRRVYPEWEGVARAWRQRYRQTISFSMARDLRRKFHARALDHGELSRPEVYLSYVRGFRKRLGQTACSLSIPSPVAQIIASFCFAADGPLASRVALPACVRSKALEVAP
jgi:hypothetical protein